MVAGAGAPAIPVLDLGLGTRAERARALHAAAAGLGFFYVTGHGVPQEAVDAAFAALKRFFAAPPAVKAALQAAPGQPPLGYSAFNSIKLDPQGQSVGDTREQFKVAGRAFALDYGDAAAGGGAGPLPAGADPEAFYWPAEAAAPGLKAALSRYFLLVKALGDELLQLVEAALGLPPGTFGAPGTFDRAMHIMSSIHYDATPSDVRRGVLGCGSHTDYGAMTLLMTDEVPGLQVCADKARPAGERVWLDVEPRRGHFVVNLGEMLERWSNGLYNANLHRVVNAAGRERFSVAFFFEPNLACPIAPFPACCRGGAAPAYEPTTYGDFLKWKYAVTGETKEAVAYSAFNEGEAGKEALYS